MSNEKNKIVRANLIPFLQGIFILVIVFGIAYRVIVFFTREVTFEHDLYYLMSLNQLVTGRIMAYGNYVRGLGALGPLVFYLYSCLLGIWASPLCLPVFSLIVNLAAIGVLFFYFRNHVDTLTGLAAAALLSACFPHIILTGEINPPIVLPLAALAWIVLFLLGLEKNSVPYFLISFIFLAFAIHSHFSGFILIVVGACIWLIRKPSINPVWIIVGFGLVLSTDYFYICAEISGNWPELKHYLNGFGALLKREFGSIFPLVRNYFKYFGIVPGLFMIVFLLGGLKMAVSKVEDTNAEVKKKLWAPWILLQCWGLSGCFFMSDRPRYFFVFIIGMCGTGAMLLRQLTESRISGVAWVATPLLFFCMIILLDIPPRYGVSYISLYRQVREVFKSESPTPIDYHTRFHTIVDDSREPGTMVFNGMMEYFFLSRELDSEANMDKHLLFFLKRRFSTPLDRQLKHIFPDLRKDRIYGTYKSRIQEDSWTLCPGGTSDWRAESWLDSEICRKFLPPLKSHKHSRSFSANSMCDENMSILEAPKLVPGNKYAFFAYTDIRNSTAKQRLIIVQATDCIDPKLMLNGKFYKSRGAEKKTRWPGGPNSVCDTWFVVPAESGWLGFDWHWDPEPEEIAAVGVRDLLFLDVIDVDMPD